MTDLRIIGVLELEKAVTKELRKLSNEYDNPSVDIDSIIEMVEEISINTITPKKSRRLDS